MLKAFTPVLALAVSATLVSCSEVSGVDVAVVGEAPANFAQLVNTAALGAGFVDASSHYALDSRKLDAHFFEIPRKDGGQAMSLETGHYRGRLHIIIGRPIYSGYSTAETAAMVTVLTALRQNGLELSKVSVRGVRLPHDLEDWLSANGHGT